MKNYMCIISVGEGLAPHANALFNKALGRVKTLLYERLLRLHGFMIL